MSIVRQNIMNDPHYTPYCGEGLCYYNWPRTEFRNGQFECRCGWRSDFEKEFIERHRNG